MMRTGASRRTACASRSHQGGDLARCGVPAPVTTTPAGGATDRRWHGSCSSNGPGELMITNKASLLNDSTTQLRVENSTDATRGEPLAMRAQKRKLELELALTKLPA